MASPASTTSVRDASAAQAEDEPGYLTRESILRRIALSPPDLPLIQWNEELAKAQSDATKYVDSWFCDLHLGREVFLSSDKQLSQLRWEQDISIDPGEVGLLMTEEDINLPNDLAAFISLRFSIARRGLVNISGRHVDPGYRGKLVFSIYNAGTHSVMMRRGDPVFMITFARLDHLAPGKAKPTIERIDRIKAEWMADLRGPPVSLLKLNKRVDQLELQFRVVVGILTTVAIAALGLALAWLAGIRP